VWRLWCASIRLSVTNPHSAVTPAADYEKLLADALDRSLGAESYRFSSRSTLHIDQESRAFSVLEGEKAGPQNRHVKGTMLSTPVDIYALGQKVYRQDAVSGSWQTLSPSEIPDTLLLLDELSPAANFKFSSLGEVKFLGKEKLDGKTCLKLQFKPVIEDEWLGRYFKDITYTVWLNGKKAYIVKTEITGQSKENPAVSLNIEILLSDFGKEIRITPPVV